MQDLDPVEDIITDVFDTQIVAIGRTGILTLTEDLLDGFYSIDTPSPAESMIQPGYELVPDQGTFLLERSFQHCH